MIYRVFLWRFFCHSFYTCFWPLSTLTLSLPNLLMCSRFCSIFYTLNSFSESDFYLFIPYVLFISFDKIFWCDDKRGSIYVEKNYCVFQVLFLKSLVKISYITLILINLIVLRESFTLNCFEYIILLKRKTVQKKKKICRHKKGEIVIIKLV